VPPPEAPLAAAVTLPAASTVIVALVYVVAVTPDVGSRAEGNVPEPMFDAFVVSVVAEAARPVIKLVGIEPADNVPTPVIPVYEPLSRAEGKVPEPMFEAFVVSVVADAANPDTAPEAIAIAVFVTAVTLPAASTVITGTIAALAYTPATTPDVASLAAAKVPEPIFEALVVSVVAEAAKPDTAPEAIAIAVFVTAVTLPYPSVVITGT
jgi:hypothetical protein